MLKARRKRALADVILLLQMMSFIALDGVTSFICLKDVHLQTHLNVCDTFQLLAGIIQCNGGKLEEAEDFKCVFFV